MQGFSPNPSHGSSKTVRETRGVAYRKSRMGDCKSKKKGTLQTVLSERLDESWNPSGSAFGYQDATSRGVRLSLDTRMTAGSTIRTRSSPAHYALPPEDVIFGRTPSML